MMDVSIRNELMALFDKRGDQRLHAEDVVEYAKSHKRSALHAEFPWDVERAAYEHWLNVARRLITVHVIDVHREPELISLRIDRPGGGGYRKISDVMASTDLAEMAFRDAVADLEHIKERFGRIERLSAVWREVDLAVASSKRKKRVRAKAKEEIRAGAG